MPGRPLLILLLSLSIRPVDALEPLPVEDLRLATITGGHLDDRNSPEGPMLAEQIARGVFPIPTPRANTAPDLTLPKRPTAIPLWPASLGSEATLFFFSLTPLDTVARHDL